jgi:hypothetical protein
VRLNDLVAWYLEQLVEEGRASTEQELVAQAQVRNCPRNTCLLGCYIDFFFLSSCSSLHA